MEGQRRILVQLDTTASVSVFDTIAALDAGVDTVLPIGGMDVLAVPKVVQDALFCRAPGSNTAFWIGGMLHEAAQAIFDAVRLQMTAPFAVGVALDPSGANTTAAAIISVLRGCVAPGDGPVWVVGASGMVGQAVSVMAGLLGYSVVMMGPSLANLQAARSRIVQRYGIVAPTLREVSSGERAEPVAAVVAAGPPGREVFDPTGLVQAAKLLIDVNAVAPSGIRGVSPRDRNTPVKGGAAWGAWAVGTRKMALQHRLVQRLFETPIAAFDCPQILDLADEFLSDALST